MRHFGILLFVISITSCSFGQFIPSGFDNVEFDRLAELNVISKPSSDKQEWCNKEKIERILVQSEVLSVYSRYTLNSNIAEIYKEINDLADEMSQKETPSAMYCKLKRQSIHDITEKALEVFGGRIKA